MPSRWDALTANNSEMGTWVAVPDAPGAHPIVAVAQHAGGVDDFIRTMCDRLAEAGFVAVAPSLFHRETSKNPQSMDDAMSMMGRLRDNNIIADMGAAIAHAKALPEARADRVGVTGFCMGGRVAYLMATHDPSLKAAVVFYGGNIMVPWGDGEAPFAASAKITAPILGLFGEDDGNPKPADVAKIDAELTRLGKPHEFHSYKGAGHAFMSEGRPSHREDAAADAWQKTIAWFKNYLS